MTLTNHIYTVVVAGPIYKLAILNSREHLASKFHFYEFDSTGLKNFRVGQHISVRVAEATIRNYSIATFDENKMGVLVDVGPGGPGSIFFKNLQVGDEMRYLGPFGGFVLRDDPDVKDVYFFVTGSGVAPIKCMLEELLIKQKTKKNVNVYFGLGTEQDIIWNDYFEELSRDYPNFRYKISLSRPSEAWTGEKGYITKFVQSMENPKASSAYLCGNPNMINDAKKLLIEKGVPTEKVYTESFFD